ncbi:hypothetical protein HanXRQr2_Chr04g0187041 [Helianthus annuus]|uniref:Uncharacterized protein n=1 Tax=Helianthus annuus TaxID=4232 RepID=A0A9K3JBJ0_HELAN|nr:hypothetical protein HanXRQr2_Chr04g0187041 [Helianthus annuus]KAJ0933056.1 hypothetical protein HanPSC8_Chr04g0180641 [Helianthus annuus]
MKSSLYDLIEELLVTWVRADIWNPILEEVRHLLSRVLVLVLPLMELLPVVDKNVPVIVVHLLHRVQLAAHPPSVYLI